MTRRNQLLPSGALLLLVAAACGAPPFESTTILQEESSSTTALATTSTTTSGASTSSGETSTSNASSESTTTAEPSTSSSDTGTIDCTPILHEVLYDPDSGATDDEFEWLELYNPCMQPIDLGAFELRWGGESYVNTAMLSGQLAPDGCFVIGGPQSTVDNDMPTYDLVFDFEDDLQNADSSADGIALFIVGEDVPVDAVIYGDENVFGLIDETGRAGAPDVGDVMRGHTIARRAEPGAPATQSSPWTDDNEPSPGQCPNPGL
jgi:hypothetical protein